MENPGITATLKAGRDFDAPWIVLHAQNPVQLNDQLDALTPELLQKVAGTAQLLIAANAIAQGDGSVAPPPPAPIQPVPYQAPTPPAQQAQPPVPRDPAPAGGRTCQHGARVRRDGTSKRGPWVGWFCPTPKGTPGQCSPEFE